MGWDGMGFMMGLSAISATCLYGKTRSRLRDSGVVSITRLMKKNQDIKKGADFGSAPFFFDYGFRLSRVYSGHVPQIGRLFASVQLFAPRSKLNGRELIKDTHQPERF